MPHGSPYAVRIGSELAYFTFQRPSGEFSRGDVPKTGPWVRLAIVASGWRAVWVKLAAVGQADVLGMRVPAGSLEKRSKRVCFCRIPLPKVSYYATATKPDFRKGICCGRGQNFTAAGLPRARPLVRDSSCQLRFVRTFPKPAWF